MAVALDLWCRVEAVPDDAWEITEDGGTYEPDPDSLVVRAAQGFGADRPYRLRIDSEIPRTRGLGSSAAVATAVAAAVRRAAGHEPADEELFTFVADLEGHADNAAAAVYGGLVATAGPLVRRLDMAPDLVLLVAVPDESLPTSSARAVLPADVPREAAARNLARAVFLTEALRSGDREAFVGAAGDELHEMHRGSLAPRSGRLMEAARAAGALHAAWSGAGPSVLAVTTTAQRDTVRAALDGVLGPAGRVLAPDIAAGWR
jgi:homoserine kinase